MIVNKFNFEYKNLTLTFTAQQFLVFNQTLHIIKLELIYGFYTVSFEYEFSKFRLLCRVHGIGTDLDHSHLNDKANTGCPENILDINKIDATSQNCFVIEPS